MLEKLLTSMSALAYPKTDFELTIIGDPKDTGKQTALDFISKSELSVQYCTIPDDPWDGKNPSAKRNYGASRASCD